MTPLVLAAAALASACAATTAVPLVQAPVVPVEAPAPLTVAVPTVRVASRPVDIFYSPHEDDETLSMGSLIVHDVRLGDDVYVVLVTDGGASKACAEHFPSRAACVRFRENEFLVATKALGVPSSHVSMWNLPDSKLTLAQATHVIQTESARHPGATNVSMAPSDANPDHAALGKALSSLHGLKAVYTVGWPYWNLVSHVGCSWVTANITAALNAYRTFWPWSVPAWFAQERHSPTDLVCRTPR